MRACDILNKKKSIFGKIFDADLTPSSLSKKIIKYKYKNFKIEGGLNLFNKENFENNCIDLFQSTHQAMEDFVMENYFFSDFTINRIREEIKTNLLKDEISFFKKGLY